MAAVFPKSSDLILKIAGAVIGLGAVGAVAGYAYFSYPAVIDTGYQPIQPVPYSHKLHVGQLGLDCFYCHSTVYKAAFAAVPATQTCMNCHAKVKDTSPRLELVRDSFADGQSIPWVHIHRLPDFVYFNHEVARQCGRELRFLPRPHRSGDRSPSGEAAEYGFLPGLPQGPRAEPAAGGAGDQARLGSGPRPARDRRTDHSRKTS